MALSTYSGLKTAIASWLNRNDLTSEIPDFITLGESFMRRDPRLRQVASRDFVAAEGYTLPSDFRSIIDLYHDGTSYYGPLTITSANELPGKKATHGDTGVPSYAAVIDLVSGPVLRFAPEPSGTINLRMTYEAELEALSDSNPSNWLLTEAPDLYLFASLVGAEGFLQEDQRVGLWKQQYEEAARKYKVNRDRREYGGRLIVRPRNVIGQDAGR